MSEQPSTMQRRAGGWWAFAPPVFLSAFLVFQIQPLISKHILPWFGGTSAVWTTCLLVFQGLLFAGYVYAHAVGRLAVKWQTAIHLLLLLVASAVTVIPAEAWKPQGGENPQLHIVAMLLATVGLPYFALSATGPLLQLWFWRAYPDRSPYPLYALSNAGSLLALLSYPFVVEPNLATPQQAAAWRVGFVVFLVLCSVGAWLVRGRAGTTPPAATVAQGEALESPAFPRHLQRWMWIAWSACSVVLFMAVTNQLTVNVASVPFLWILPLSIYLVTFILAFAGWGYPRRWSVFLLAVSVAGLAFILQLELDGDFRPGMPAQLVIVAAALFGMCLVCHGELYRLRPEPRRLTSYYLSIAFGGMLGGIVVGVVAPRIFLLYQELHVGMLLCCLLYLVTVVRDAEGPLPRGRWVAVPIVAGIVGLAGLLAFQANAMLAGSLDTRRNFFGLLRVFEVGGSDSPDHAFQLYDGSVLHGYQFARPDLQARPTIYYSTQTGVGGVMTGYRADRGRRVGIVGLGVGTLAAYGRPEDYLRFYEINPDVVDLATTKFSYLSRCRSRWDIALGDARLSLEQEPDQEFDVLILDAFSSDSIPVHLLTVEAFDLYERHLLDEGVVAVHISNDHLDLSTIVYRIAEERGFFALEVRNREADDRLTLAASWMVLSRDLDFVKALTSNFDSLRQAGDVVLANRPPESSAGVRAWTDRYSNLLQILR